MKFCDPFDISKSDKICSYYFVVTEFSCESRQRLSLVSYDDDSNVTVDTNDRLSRVPFLCTRQETHMSPWTRDTKIEIESNLICGMSYARN